MKEPREGILQNHWVHIVLVIIMAICGIAFFSIQNVYADDIASGTCGTCDWVIDEDGTLIISEGVLDDWGEKPPWYEYRSKIKYARTEGEVVITTGYCMFYDCESIIEIDLSGSIIAEGANTDYMLATLHYHTLGIITVGNWSEVTNLPAFPVGMCDTETMTDYAKNEAFPAVDGHRFIVCKRQTGGYEVTNVEINNNVLGWGDDYEVTVDYVGNEPVISGWARFRGTVDGSPGASPDEQTFDPDTGIGCVTFQGRIDKNVRMGEYHTFTIRLYGKHSNGGINDYALFYDICPVIIKPPYENVVFDKDYDDPDLMDALNGLQDGEAAFVRCGTVLEGELPAELEPRQGERYEDTTYYEIKADYYEVIKGKDVTLYIPLAFDSQMVVNGMDVRDPIKSVYQLSNISPLHFNHRHNIEETRILDFKLTFVFPKNGSLPCKTLYRFPFYPFADEVIDFIGEMNIPFTYEDIIGYIDTSYLYYLQDNATLVRDGGSIELNGDWINVTIDHNSKFVASNADPKDLRSFEASTSKSGYTYTGKTIKPSVTLDIEPDMGTSSDYTTTYSSKNSKAIGTYSITVKAQKNGYGTQTIKYKINPKGTSISSKSGKRKAFTVKWKKQSAKMPTKRITGYQIQYSTSKSNLANGKKVKVKGYTKTSKTIKSLKAKKKYYVRVRTYMTVGGTNYYSGWSGTKSVTTK